MSASRGNARAATDRMVAGTTRVESFLKTDLITRNDSPDMAHVEQSGNGNKRSRNCDAGSIHLPRGSVNKINSLSVEPLENDCGTVCSGASRAKSQHTHGTPRIPARLRLAFRPPHDVLHGVQLSFTSYHSAG